VGIFDDNLVDGLGTVHVVTVVFAGLAEAALNGVQVTWSHILPTEKHAQYIFRHWLLLQLQPVYLFLGGYYSKKLRMMRAGAVRR